VQAIGNAVAREFPDLKVAYVTVEAFANEFIQSIQKKPATSSRTATAGSTCC